MLFGLLPLEIGARPRRRDLFARFSRALTRLGGGRSETDPLPMLQLFDKQIQLRMGQANVWRWVPDLLPLVSDGDPLGAEGFASHHLPLADAPEAYERFQKKADGFVKVLLQP